MNIFIYIDLIGNIRKDIQIMAESRLNWKGTSCRKAPLWVYRTE